MVNGEGGLKGEGRRTNNGEPPPLADGIGTGYGLAKP